MMSVHLARDYSSRSRPPRMPKTRTISAWKIRRLIEFIEESLDGDLTLEAMAGEVEISPLYLPRAFKSAGGQSPHQYVLARRIQRARGLFRNTDSPLVEGGLSSRFSPQSHLCHWFFRAVGVSPS